MLCSVLLYWSGYRRSEQWWPDNRRLDKRLTYQKSAVKQLPSVPVCFLLQKMGVSKPCLKESKPSPKMHKVKSHCVILFIKLKTMLLPFINRWLSRLSTGRVSGAEFSWVRRTKVEAHKSFLFTETYFFIFFLFFPSPPLPPCEGHQPMSSSCYSAPW